MKCATGAVLLFAAVGALFLAGCGGEETPLTCEYCEHWSLLIDGFARYPAYSPDPGHPDRIAFSSKLPDPNGVTDEDRFEHIWVKDGEDLYRITNESFNDIQPSWSPDGTRIAFTRELQGRMDIWTVNVADLSSPSVPVRVTSEITVPMGAYESTWMESGGLLWLVFTSEDDIYRVSDSGGTPTKLIPDPEDVAGHCGFPALPDLQPVVGPDGRVAFTAVGRGDVGNLEVSGYFVADSGETTEVNDAMIYLDDCATGFITPHTFHFLPVKPDQGTYSVGVQSPAHCDRRFLYPVIRRNQNSRLRFNFVPTAGDVYVWLYEANANIFDVFEGDTTFFFRIGTGFPVPGDSTLKCLAPGLHTILVQWNSFSRDDTIRVAAGEIDSLFFFESKTAPHALMSPFAGGDTPASRAPSQTVYEAIWVADLDAYDMTGFWSANSQFERATWSPTGQYIAFVASDLTRNTWGIRVVDVESGSSSIRSIPLPGSPSASDCRRSAYHLSWNSSGDRLAVAMGDCLSSSGPQELQIWLVDPRPFLGK